MKEISEYFQLALALSGRLLLSMIFIISGLNKISTYANTSQYMDAMGVSESLLPMVIALEVIGGLMLLLGYKTKVITFFLAGFCLISAFMFHFDLSEQNQFIHFFKNVAIAGGLLLVVAGDVLLLSIDRKQTD